MRTGSFGSSWPGLPSEYAQANRSTIGALNKVRYDQETNKVKIHQESFILVELAVIEYLIIPPTL